MKDEILGGLPVDESKVVPRYKLVLPDGTIVADNVELILKNPIVQSGTRLNAENFLTDATAMRYGFTSVTGTVNAVLTKIAPFLMDTAPRLVTLMPNIEKLNTDIIPIIPNLKALSTDIYPISTKLIALSNEIHPIITQIKSLVTNIHPITSNLQNLSTNITPIVGNLQSLSMNVTPIIPQLNSLVTNIYPYQDELKLATELNSPGAIVAHYINLELKYPGKFISLNGRKISISSAMALVAAGIWLSGPSFTRYYALPQATSSIKFSIVNVVDRFVLMGHSVFYGDGDEYYTSYLNRSTGVTASVPNLSGFISDFVQLDGTNIYVLMEVLPSSAICYFHVVDFGIDTDFLTVWNARKTYSCMVKMATRNGNGRIGGVGILIDAFRHPVDNMLYIGFSTPPEIGDVTVHVIQVPYGTGSATPTNYTTIFSQQIKNPSGNPLTYGLSRGSFLTDATKSFLRLYCDFSQQRSLNEPNQNIVNTHYTADQYLEIGILSSSQTIRTVPFAYGCSLRSGYTQKATQLIYRTYGRNQIWSVPAYRADWYNIWGMTSNDGITFIPHYGIRRSLPDDSGSIRVPFVIKDKDIARLQISAYGILSVYSATNSWGVAYADRTSSPVYHARIHTSNEFEGAMTSSPYSIVIDRWDLLQAPSMGWDDASGDQPIMIPYLRIAI